MKVSDGRTETVIPSEPKLTAIINCIIKKILFWGIWTKAARLNKLKPGLWSNVNLGDEPRTFLLDMDRSYTLSLGKNKPNCSQFPAFQFSAWLTWMGIKSFNQAAPRYFPNVFGPNSSNSDSKTSQFTGAERLKDTNVFFGPGASRDDTITQFGQYENCLGTLSRVLILQRKFWFCSCILRLCERKQLSMPQDGSSLYSSSKKGNHKTAEYKLLLWQSSVCQQLTCLIESCKCQC